MGAVVFVIVALSCVPQAGAASSVTIDWTKFTLTSRTTPTLQVVVNPQLRRGSHIHDGAFTALARLNTTHIRFVPWFPYPKLVVAELDPPTGNPVCGGVINLQSLYLACADGVFTSIDFASYGTPSGHCGSFVTGKCNAANSKTVVEKYCLGKRNCSIPVTTPVFGDPCYGTVKYLYVQATCSPSYNRTSWNFDLIDPIMEDFMNATKGKSVIINFSTIPEWMWNPSSPPTPYPSDPNQVDWGYERGTQLRDPSMIQVGEYYRRLVSWYMNGGFADEYGKFHSSGHHYDIPFWEVLNEVDAEHQMSPEFYTELYDVIVSEILKVAPRMRFVGMALAFHKEWNWYEYFLNRSNHRPGIPLDMISYHFYGSPSSRTDVNSYLTIFREADGFIEEVAQIQAIRQRLSPHTSTTIDEVGVILPNDNDPNPAPIPDAYWNAAGAMYAYLFSNLAKKGIEFVGESQLVGFPTQFPSVTMIDWTNGKPNSRYWVLKMLTENNRLGDKFVQTHSTDSDVYAQAYVTTGNTKKILLVNKSLQVKNVNIAGIKGGKMEVVDTTTKENPPAFSYLNSNSVQLQPWAVAIITLPR